MRRVADDCSEADLVYRPDADANSIAWLLWHLSRAIDRQVAEIGGREPVWTAAGWADRFALPLDVSDTGYGHTSDQVAAVQAPADLLVGYHDAVQQMTSEVIDGLDAADLERIIDRRWDPPVTVGVRLVSILADCLQHLGQAAYVLGLAHRRR